MRSRPIPNELTRVLLLEGGASPLCGALVRDPRLFVSTVDSFEKLGVTVDRFHPGVIVIVLEFPTPEDVVAVRALRAAVTVPILMISRPVEDRRITELIKAGASGYLLAEDSHLAPQAVREAILGGVPMSPAIARLVLGRARRSSANMPAVVPAADAPQLTPRQKDILRLLARGHSYDGISRALGVTVNTVRTHVRMLYDRIGVSTRVEAVFVAMDLGLIDRPR